MCRSKKSTDVVEPGGSSAIQRTPRASRSSRPSSADDPSSSYNLISNNFTTSSSYKGSSYSSFSSSASLAGIKASLPDNPHIYEFSELSSATGNFLRNRFSSSSSSSSWRCSLRGKEAIVFQRKFRRPIESPELQIRLSTICRSHHNSLIKLLGASISGNYIYLAYEFVRGANLADCLRNSKNPSFTILSTWLSRMQIATDLAHGLDYVHHCSGLRSNFVHNHIKTSSIVIVSDESMNAKLCHFGTSELCGEIESEVVTDSENSREIESEITVKKTDSSSSSKKNLKKSRSRALKVEGTRGYMAPEFQLTGTPTQKCDVYAFGVVILELLSGEEPLKYRLEEAYDGGYRRVSVIETARAAVEGGELRKWVDRRMKDSYPVEVAEKMIRVGLDCVEGDPAKRPDMGRVAGLVSMLFLESQNWAKKIGMPTDFSVSLAPR
ncbi:receptor-like serine/threonine-protein kinase At2g45590 [Humulus lupulus]|uniref:receptor-like serine/threonine-protein kinase At2g45590 n=1 Tax=Humulus lupulus TaxID=3486 RepID=UPI002B408635|nr:receptor-like serine/threonine-protein kinase At2g45590 [Humulus lupulus]